MTRDGREPRASAERAGAVQGRMPWRARARVAIAAAASVALVASLGACGLLPLPRPDATSTPDTSGVAAELLPYYGQTLVWHACENDLQCTTAQAPLDWADPAGERIELALIRSPATGTKQGSLFVNPGGPGASGYDFLASGVGSAVDAELSQRFDVVSWDPRGVGRSTPISCGTPAQLDDFYFGIVPGEVGSDAWFSSVFDGARAFARRCAASQGDLIAHVDTVSTARDLDLLRALVGEAKLDYLGYSYGTFIGSVYAETFPERTGRLVLDGAVDPSESFADGAARQAAGFDSALRAYVTDCLARERCPLSGTVATALGDVHELLERLDASPLRAADGRELGGATALTAIITPLYSRAAWPNLDQLFASLERGDPSVAFALADSYYERQSADRYGGNLIEMFFATSCLDGGEPADAAQLTAQAATIEAAAPVLGRWLGPLSGEPYNGNACAVWPYPAVLQPHPITASGSSDILVVGTTNDPATPYASAVALAGQLEHGHLVSYTGEGHTAYNGSSACVDRVVDAYVVHGTVPATDPRC
ncbi:alpha/beta hydrolase [Galbitalea sp. SE-J8]|uniref:alpha/beta hydrolase n=1 Tax=Galbitalea sp. SE-J8 TaxID=3054952 RepID=UPI00259CCED4|nr:alpha/beta hydrolase [Galbitalea sp. SE-J8]MDM4763605.1 alpha/beta hydrolase [Galbitalea sp. SE-J8]